MTRKGPWGAEEAWELSETQFAAKDIGRNGSGREGTIQNGSKNGSAREENGQNGSKQNGQNGNSQNGRIQNGASAQNGRSKNGTGSRISNQNGEHWDGNGIGKNTQTADTVSKHCLDMNRLKFKNIARIVNAVQYHS